MKITKTGQAFELGIKILGFGLSNSKKTRLIQTAPRPLIINIEDKLGSIDKDGIPVITVSNAREALKAIDHICRPEEIKEYDTICIDSITELAEMITVEAHAKCEDARKYTGEAYLKTMEVINRLKKIPEKNIYMIAKADEDTSKTKGMGYKFTPMMPGTRLQKCIAYQFSYVFAMRKIYDDEGNSQDVMQFVTDGDWFANDVSNTLPQFIKPNLTKVFNLLNNRFKTKEEK